MTVTADFPIWNKSLLDDTVVKIIFCKKVTEGLKGTASREIWVLSAEKYIYIFFKTLILVFFFSQFMVWFVKNQWLKVVKT